jgi:hypothetical protein
MLQFDGTTIGAALAALAAAGTPTAMAAVMPAPVINAITRRRPGLTRSCADDVFPTKFPLLLTARRPPQAMFLLVRGVKQ